MIASRARSRAVTACSVMAVALFAAQASAQPSPERRALAESLFDDGRALMKARDLTNACPKLAESQRLDPGGGTLLNLAICHERQQRTATAWSEFRAALAQARAEGRADRARVALEHIAAVEPVLPRLRLRVSGARAHAGLVLELDGAELGPAGWGSPLAVDPGDHIVTARAPGRQSWWLKCRLTPGQNQSITVPPLAPEHPEPARGEGRLHAASSLGERQRVRRSAAWVTSGLSAGLLLTGGYFGLRALDKRRDSDAHCPNDECTAEGVTLNDQARSSARVADVLIGAGLLGAGVSAYLWLTAQAPAADPRRPKLSAALAPCPGGGSVVLGRRF